MRCLMRCLAEQRVEHQRHKEFHPPWELSTDIGFHDADFQASDCYKWTLSSGSQSTRELYRKNIIGLAKLGYSANRVEIASQIHIVEMYFSVLRGAADYDNSGCFPRMTT